MGQRRIGSSEEGSSSSRSRGAKVTPRPGPPLRLFDRGVGLQVVQHFD